MTWCAMHKVQLYFNIGAVSYLVHLHDYRTISSELRPGYVCDGCPSIMMAVCIQDGMYPADEELWGRLPRR